MKYKFLFLFIAVSFFAAAPTVGASLVAEVCELAILVPS
jgi:hypothetical protein